MSIIVHYPSCTALYPEKVTGESAQLLIEIDIGDATILQCVDCGAFVEKEKLETGAEK